MAPPYCLKSRFGAEISSVSKRSLKSGSNPGQAHEKKKKNKLKY